MMGNNDPYLIRLLEASVNYYSRSFSGRYTNWKRYYSINKSFAQELKKLKTKDKSIKMLDVGCNDGWLIYRLKTDFDKKYNLEFTGIDLSETNIDFAKKRKEYFGWKGCEFIVMDANQLNFKDEEFDIVICTEVIEYIIDPLLGLKVIYRVLKKDGLAIITTPNKNGGILAKLLRFINILSLGIIKKKKQAREEKFIDEKELPHAPLSSDKGITGAGYSHISVKSKFEWLKIFEKIGFATQSVSGTASMLQGDPYIDEHRILFAGAVILDTILENFPFSYFWCESILFELRKK